MARFKKLTTEAALKELVKRMDDALTVIREEYFGELSSNSIQWIDDDLDYINVKFYKNPPDGTQQIKYSDEEPESISAREAIHILNVRINNTLDALGL